VVDGVPLRQPPELEHQQLSTAAMYALASGSSVSEPPPSIFESVDSSVAHLHVSVSKDPVSDKLQGVLFVNANHLFLKQHIRFLVGNHGFLLLPFCP
jgi:hypothetical protein